MSPKKTSPSSNMRSAQSYDHLDNSIRSPIERSHSSHNIHHMKSVESSYHLSGAYGNANYGSMPRAQRKPGFFFIFREMFPLEQEYKTYQFRILPTSNA